MWEEELRRGRAVLRELGGGEGRAVQGELDKGRAEWEKSWVGRAFSDGNTE